MSRNEEAPVYNVILNRKRGERARERGMGQVGKDKRWTKGGKRDGTVMDEMKFGGCRKDEAVSNEFLKKCLSDIVEFNAHIHKQARCKIPCVLILVYYHLWL